MSKRVTRTRLAAVAAAATLVVLAGCSSPAPSDKASAASCTPAKGKVTLQYWNTVPGMDKVVDLWNKKNPDVQVQTKNISNDQYGTLGNALKAGKAPDLAQVGYDELPNLRTQNAFVDASACSAATAAKSKFVPWTWSQTSFGGTGVFALPQDTGPMALFVRSDIFKKHGIAIPTTWDEYAAAAQKLHKADPNLDITFFDPNNAEWFNGLLWQNSAQMYSLTSRRAPTSRLTVRRRCTPRTRRIRSPATSAPPGATACSATTCPSRLKQVVDRADADVGRERRLR
ncbi:ABC transporter substrate-binding protein [Streptomyces sp. S1D4-11]